jgi:hypothetical protein
LRELFEKAFLAFTLHVPRTIASPALQLIVIPSSMFSGWTSSLTRKEYS